MKTKYLYLVPFLAIFLSSCVTTSYYYSTLNSNSSLVQKNEQGDLIIENDSVLITYNFYGENAPIRISVYNKLDKPLYVDWYKSALILNDVATTYKSNQMRINGNISSSSYKYNDSFYTDTESKLSGSIRTPSELTFIPPKSKIEYDPLELTGFPFDSVRQERYSKNYLFTREGTGKKVKVADFEKEDSPLTFRSYLTIYSGDDHSLNNPLVFQHEFYVSRLVKAGSFSPKDMYANNLNRDVFYVKETHGEAAASIGLAVVVLGASVALDVMDAKMNNNNK